ncbi:hypothetical protein [Streptomyces sp. 3214.6]|uniref:hypothetical protein n=1 Tax=Streptomyces sp. 3214.6 TaxID=1882757 RepID=UPI00090C05F8|nr:hypothetical protein [Streptomyces sp. 3214.6]SHI66976.1 hypothetical protein SAMN05444521_8190 [Streptomyces sp. 3214.6]
MTTHTPPQLPAAPVDERPDGFMEFPEQASVLSDTLTAAGVELGAYERVIIDWLSRWEWATVAVIASWVARAATVREPAPPVALPGRFDASPADVDQHLRRTLAEDTYLRYQQAIGGRAVTEAAQDITDDSWSRRDRFGRYEREEYEAGMRKASELVDPAEDGGPYPSQLQCSQHDGFGPCPGAPRCTPKEND